MPSYLSLIFLLLLISHSVVNAYNFDEDFQQDYPCLPMIQFDCQTTPHKCIPIRFQCDGALDCDNGIDEKNCGLACPYGYFTCDSGECVEQRYTCNIMNDCRDGSDERNCPSIEVPTTPSPTPWDICSSGDLVCDGRCIPMALVCDKEVNCEDGADELNCKKQCGPGDVVCDDGCVPMEALCNKTVECKGGWDEKHCTMLKERLNSGFGSSAGVLRVLSVLLISFIM